MVQCYTGQMQQPALSVPRLQELQQTIQGKDDVSVTEAAPFPALGCGFSVAGIAETQVDILAVVCRKRGLGTAGTVVAGAAPAVLPLIHRSMTAQCTGYVSAWLLSHRYVGLFGGFLGSFDILFCMLSKNKSEFVVHPSVTCDAAFKKSGHLLTRVE